MFHKLYIVLCRYGDILMVVNMNKTHKNKKYDGLSYQLEKKGNSALLFSCG